MAETTRELKRKLGSVLVKLKKQEHGLNQEEWQIAKVLEGKGLAKFLGPDRAPKVMSPMEALTHNQLAALAHFVLTGAGEEYILRYSEAHLLAGSFLLPGETPWYDSWPWKLVWPALVSLVTALIVTAFKGTSIK